MAGITLHYFDVHARGECIKMIMRYYGMVYSDHLIDFMQEWPKLKTEGFTEFGQVPRLDIDGMQMVQSYAIYRYLCQKNGAYPTDPYEIYLVESICNLRDDIYNSLNPNFYSLYTTGNWEGVDNWYRDNMPRMLKMVERRLIENGQQGHFFVGSKVTMADFVMFQLGYDHFLRPNLKEKFEAVLRDNAPTFYQFVLHFKESNANLRSYLANRPEKTF